MYKIDPTQLHWVFSTLVRLDSIIIVPDGGSYLNLYVPLDGSRTPLRGFSGLPIATSASRLFVSERRAARPMSTYPNKHIHTRRPIGVVPGPRMGLFRNNTFADGRRQFKLK
ncbi:hypothetical protein Zmor_002721 [Zophobas morio]|uniref:Uncharacterized protein n=1 Tax=Zophobas morio TaxID=2755281 RepID=A0AA38HQJ6_9CUCU|nr:hypothetical protein Zmor_002721 [Zophobas morio]